MSNVKLDVAAGLAKTAGIISDREYARLADGTVSWYDLRQASDLIDALEGKPLRQVLAMGLEAAIEDQLAVETGWEIFKENVHDMFDRLGD
jgi:hypothetical protein